MSAYLSIFTVVAIKINEEIFDIFYKETEIANKIANKYKIDFTLESEENEDFYCLYLKDNAQGVVEGCVYIVSDYNIKNSEMDDNTKKDISERFVSFIKEFNKACETNISINIEAPKLKVLIVPSI